MVRAGAATLSGFDARRRRADRAAPLPAPVPLAGKRIEHPAAPATGTGTAPLTTSTSLSTLGILPGGTITVGTGGQYDDLHLDRNRHDRRPDQRHQRRPADQRQRDRLAQRQAASWSSPAGTTQTRFSSAAAAPMPPRSASASATTRSCPKPAPAPPALRIFGLIERVRQRRPRPSSGTEQSGASSTNAASAAKSPKLHWRSSEKASSAAGITVGRFRRRAALWSDHAGLMPARPLAPDRDSQRRNAYARRTAKTGRRGTPSGRRG